MRKKLLLYLAFPLLGAACALPDAPSVVTEPASGMLAVEGGQIYYETLGSGPAVMLIHGGFGDRRMWDEQFRALAASYRVVRYDHRGFGRSSAPQAAYSPVADLNLLLSHLGIERASLIGNSLGGTLALDYALKHPERVAKIIVVASGASGYPVSEEEIESVRSIFRTAEERGAQTALELWLNHPMLSATHSYPPARERIRHMVTDNSAIFRMQHWPSEPMQPPAYERLSEIRQPTLVIVGDHDTPLVRQMGAATAARIQGARLVTMENADHLPQMEKPEEFNRLIREFLSSP